MSSKQLRNHITYKGPIRREPVDGTETDMRVSLGFKPSWFSNRVDVDLGERWHKAPYIRHNALLQKRTRTLFPRYSNLIVDF